MNNNSISLQVIDPTSSTEKIDSIQFTGSSVRYEFDLPANAEPEIKSLTANTVNIESSTSDPRVIINNSSLSFIGSVDIYGKSLSNTSYEKLGNISGNTITLGSNNGMGMNYTIIEGGSISLNAEGGIYLSTITMGINLTGSVTISGTKRPTYNGTSLALSSDITMSSDGTTLTISYNK